MTVERIHPKAPVMLIFIAIFTCLPSCINLSNINTAVKNHYKLTKVYVTVDYHFYVVSSYYVRSREQDKYVRSREQDKYVRSREQDKYVRSREQDKYVKDLMKTILLQHPI